MKKRILPPLLFLMTLTLAMAGGVCGAEGPIRISSDRLDAYDDKALVLFSGSVVVTQDDAVIHGDKLYLYYDKKDAGENVPSGTVLSSGKIKRIELRGNVNMKRGDRIVTGDKAILHNPDQRIVMTGNVVMREGDNVITGERVTVFLKENRGIVDSHDKEKRVTAVIYPKESSSKDTTSTGGTQ